VQHTTLSGPRTPGLFNSLAFGFFPRHTALGHARKFGRIYRMPALQGDIVVTAEPEHIKRIFSAESDTFRTYSRPLRGVFGAQSVLLTWGPPHKRQRKLLAPPLTGTRLRAFGDTMQQLADRHVGSLRVGSTFRALDLTTAFTLDVIVSTVFGVTGEAEARELSGLLQALVHGLPPIAIFAPPLQQPWFPPWRRFLAARAGFDRWVGHKIAERRQSGSAGSDVLSLLLEARYDDGSAMSDDEVRAQLVTLLLAGHETTSIALALCMGRLARHPHVRARLADELAGPEAGVELARLPYLSAVIDETLRIDPIVSDVARIPNADFALDERHTVSSRQLLLVMIEALHHDPALYPDPGVFRPERFLERKFTPFEYAPFGGGVRRCLGAAFSDYETKIMLATLVRRTALSLVGPPDRRVRRNITMGPAEGVPLRVDALR
jgi:cytochrome P450 family 110